MSRPDTFTERRLAWFEAMARNNAVQPLAFRAAIYLATVHLNRTLGVAFPAWETIAAALGTKGIEGVRKALKHLESLGFMRVEIKRVGR